MTRALRRAALIAVGDELLAGAHPDSNSPELARRLARLGLAVVRTAIVGDDERAIARAVGEALAEADLVVVTGGLGPTLDDVTRAGVASALGRVLVQSPEALHDLEAWYERRGVPMPAPNLRQTYLPQGAERLRNRAGTAPGFVLEEARGLIVVLPGPPREMRVLFAEEVEPRLVGGGWVREPIVEHGFHLIGLSESVFAEEVGEWMARDASPRMGCTVKDGVLSVVLRATGDDQPQALARLEARAQEFRERFVPYVFSENESAIEFVFGRELLARGTKIAVAESCTGGLVAALLTRVPGISAVFERGFITYSDRSKTELVRVPKRLLEQHGAVSAKVAEAMASGAREASGADLALAVTGVAGPFGGTPEKPVGLVWFATAFGEDVRSESRSFPPHERDWIRDSAARTALFLGWKRLRERVD